MSDLVGDNPFLTLLCWWALKWLDVLTTVISLGYYPQTSTRLYEGNWFSAYFLKSMGARYFLWYATFIPLIITVSMHYLKKKKVKNTLIKYGYLLAIIIAIIVPLNNLYKLGMALGIF